MSPINAIGKNMVAFKIGHMLLEQMNIPFDILRQADLMRQQMHHPDAAAGDGTVTIGQFIPDVARPEHGLRLVGPVSAGQAIPDATLVPGQSLMGFSFHLKSLLA